MRVRFEIYRNGRGTGDRVECDLEDKKARARFAELKKYWRCGWVELVGEEEENYMEVIESFERIQETQRTTAMLDSIFT